MPELAVVSKLVGIVPTDGLALGAQIMGTEICEHAVYEALGHASSPSRPTRQKAACVIEKIINTCIFLFGMRSYKSRRVYWERVHSICKPMLGVEIRPSEIREFVLALVNAQRRFDDDIALLTPLLRAISTLSQNLRTEYRKGIIAGDEADFMTLMIEFINPPAESRSMEARVGRRDVTADSRLTKLHREDEEISRKRGNTSRMHPPRRGLDVTESLQRQTSMPVYIDLTGDSPIASSGSQGCPPTPTKRRNQGAHQGMPVEKRILGQKRRHDVDHWEGGRRPAKRARTIMR